MFFSRVDRQSAILFKRNDFLLMPDNVLADHCRIDVFCGSGPGGQHRNRNYTAVRAVFKVLEGFTAEESAFRSQKQNLSSALQKLRFKLACSWREEMPEDFSYRHFNESNILYPAEFARLLDVLVDSKFDHRMAAARANISATSLLKELSRDYTVWDEFMQIRSTLGLSELKKPRS